MNMELIYDDGMVFYTSTTSRFEYTSDVSMYFNPFGQSIPCELSSVNPHSFPCWQTTSTGYLHL